ncbi:lipopolysaccharide biosynthesis protein RfbH [Synergistaceae bacterium OttesenSCG-928-I11]|nr:lipopolysaccharide biosynthesis protein RfbH [Synergistaceae bacterium OttesenSCG-928-I11]
MDESKADKIRAKIFSHISEYKQAAFPDKTFISGQTPVPVSGKVFDEDDIVALVDASLDFWLTAGRYVDLFERQFAEVCGLRYSFLVNSGSSANLLAIAALTSPTLKNRAIKPGDEVITVAAGFPTTVNPIYQVGAVPVFVDVEIPTYNTTPERIEAALSPKTKAIILAHTLGNPFDAESIAKIAKDNDIWLIEDCCDALGSELHGRKVGTFGDIATYSFYPAHHITMGEGGAVSTDSGELAKLIQSFRDWGRDCTCATGHDNRCGKRFSQKFGKLPTGYDHKYVYSEIGYNLKVTDMQAAVGVSQLKKLDFFIKIRKENFAYLCTALKEYDRIFMLPQAEPNSNPSWFGLPLAIRQELGIDREDLLRYLDAKKIGTRLLFGGNLTKQPAYIEKKHKIAGELKNTDFVMNNVFWLGVYPGLTCEMLDYVVDSIGEALKVLR